MPLLPPTSPLFPYTTLFRSPTASPRTATTCGPRRSSRSSRTRCPRSSIRSTSIPSHSRSEEHTPELQSPYDIVCRLLLEKKKIRGRYHKNVLTAQLSPDTNL